MKKTLLIVFIFFTVQAYSQKISFGISAGPNYTSLPGTGTLNGSLSDGYIAGFQAGASIDIGFKSFSIQPGTFFTTTGGQGQLSNISFDRTVTTTVNNKIVLDYVKIPVNLLYKVKATGGRLFLGGGPYAAVGVSGKISYATNKSYGTTDRLTFGSGSADIKNSDFGIDILAGYKLNSGLAISAGYSSGLTNIYNGRANNKNKGSNISVGYFF
jgi:hypothetical protein